MDLDGFLRIDVLRAHEITGLISADRNETQIEGTELLTNLLERCAVASIAY
jgi:hypothetical protein